MDSKSVFNILTLGLLILAKVNSLFGNFISNKYSGQCNEIYSYLESQEKSRNLHYY